MKSLFEARHGQNPYAYPKRTAKFAIRNRPQRTGDSVIE
jgi:hypothetical protein